MRVGLFGKFPRKKKTFEGKERNEEIDLQTNTEGWKWNKKRLTRGNETDR